MNEKKFPSDQRHNVNQLKEGTYMPFMQAVPYDATIIPDNGHLVEFHPESKTYSASFRDEGNYSELVKNQSKSEKEYTAIMKKKKTLNYSRLEVIERQFDKTTIPIMPRYYHNPLQYFDHVLLADGYINSFAGTVVDAFVDFIMPKQLKPVLKLRNPTKHGTPEAQRKLIESNQDIIETLQAVDKFYNDDTVSPQDTYLGIPFQHKMKSLITNALVFGRNCLVMENWDHLPTFKYNGIEYEEIPNVLKIVQSIDMGMIEIDAYTGKLGGIYMYNSVPFVSTKNMIYLVNKYASPMIGSMYYGFSLIQRCIDPVRLYRRILAQNLQQFIRSSHSGMGYFLFDSTAYPDNVRGAIRTNIINSYIAGEIGIIDYANIKDLDFKEIKIHPEIMPMIELKNSLVKLTIAIIGMPQSLIFDEAAANRATLVGKVVSYFSNQVPEKRSSFGEQIASQWYMRNFRILFKGKKEILETFYIAVEFDEMELETKLEKVERLLQETQLNPYKDEYIGKELGIEGYLAKIDTAKRDKQEQQQQGDPFKNFKQKPQSTFKVTDADTGQKSTFRKSAI